MPSLRQTQPSAVLRLQGLVIAHEDTSPDFVLTRPPPHICKGSLPEHPVGKDATRDHIGVLPRQLVAVSCCVLLDTNVNHCYCRCLGPGSVVDFHEDGIWMLQTSHVHNGHGIM